MYSLSHISESRDEHAKVFLSSLISPFRNQALNRKTVDTYWGIFISSAVGIIIVLLLLLLQQRGLHSYSGKRGDRNRDTPWILSFSEPTWLEVGFMPEPTGQKLLWASSAEDAGRKLLSMTETRDRASPFSAFARWRVRWLPALLERQVWDRATAWGRSIKVLNDTMIKWRHRKLRSPFVIY